MRFICKNISYASHEAVEFADKSMEMISYYAILLRANSPKRAAPIRPTKDPNGTAAFCRSTPSIFSKKSEAAISKWIAACRSIGRLCANRSKNTACATATPWRSLRQRPSPISPASPNRLSRCTNICLSNRTSPENSQFPTSYLVEKLKELGLWDEEMLDDLKYFDGSISEIERIPA